MMASVSQLDLQVVVLVLVLLVIISSPFFYPSIASRNPIHQGSNHLHYHNGTLLTGRITINLLWYGKFSPSQREIVSDFITSLSSSPQKQPSVSTWWKSIDRYYRFAGAPAAPLSLRLGRQLLDPNYSLGKSLSRDQILHIAAKDNHRTNNAVNVVLTADDVAVDGFCQSKCGNHGYSSSTTKKLAYIWIGNAEAQCPGYCAWPIYGPQNKSLPSPNNDMGLDGMVANFAGLLASTVTNPFGHGYYYHGGGDDNIIINNNILEAASACPGPGYAGDLLVDPITGASYNANGAHGRRYLVPAIYNPITCTCFTPI